MVASGFSPQPASSKEGRHGIGAWRRRTAQGMVDRKRRVEAGAGDGDASDQPCPTWPCLVTYPGQYRATLS